MAEGDAAGFAVVLASDTHPQAGLDATTFRDGELHQMVDAGLVDGLERVDCEYLLRDVGLQELIALTSGLQLHPQVGVAEG